MQQLRVKEDPPPEVTSQVRCVPFLEVINGCSYSLLQEMVRNKLAISGAIVVDTGVVRYGILASDLDPPAAVPAEWRPAVNTTYRLITVGLGSAVIFNLPHHWGTIAKSSLEGLRSARGCFR